MFLASEVKTMIEPLIRFYSFFLALVDSLPDPIKAFIGLVIACFVIVSIVHLLNSLR